MANFQHTTGGDDSIRSGGGASVVTPIVPDGRLIRSGVTQGLPLEAVLHATPGGYHATGQADSAKASTVLASPRCRGLPHMKVTPAEAGIAECFSWARSSQFCCSTGIRALSWNIAGNLEINTRSEKTYENHSLARLHSDCCVDSRARLTRPPPTLTGSCVLQQDEFEHLVSFVRNHSCPN